MSPSVSWDRGVILSSVRAARPRPDLRVWVDMGTAEGRRALEDARLLKAALVGSGWAIGRDLHYAEYEGATHSEQAWAERAGAMLAWLFYAPGMRYST
jgi:predicted alpha/beta superfamily hydrolase